MNTEETWHGTDRDYSYLEVCSTAHSAHPTAQLLARAFRLIRRNNPEAGERKPYMMIPPQVVRDGNKRTIFANITEIASR